MNPRCPQYSPLAAGLRKTGAVLVLIFFWILLAFGLPAQVSADEECIWFRYEDKADERVCKDINEGMMPAPIPDPTPDATPDPPQQPQQPTPDPTPDPPPPPPPPPAAPEQPNNGGGNNPSQPIIPKPADTGQGVADNSAGNPTGSNSPANENRNRQAPADVAGGSPGSAVQSTSSHSEQPCPHLPPWIQVTVYTSSAHCQVVSGAGIGIQSILDQGPLGAVDISGPKNLQADVCFAAWGTIIFLDATTMPRSQHTLPVFYPGDGATCAYINRPGTVILLPGAPEHVVEAQPEADPAPERKKLSNLVFLIKDDAESAVSLDDCRVRARQNIFVRLAPAGERTGLIIAGRTMTALARTDNWFLVLLDGAGRWVSAHFVNMIGGCTLQVDSEAAGAKTADERTDSGEQSDQGSLTADRAESAVSLADCRISARQTVHARMAPAGQSNEIILRSQTLTALARTENWFLVLLNGAGRWVSAQVVNMDGSCK